MQRTKKGAYQVTHKTIDMNEAQIQRRDFDAEEWYYFWRNCEGLQLLRLEEIEGDRVSVGFVEFSIPVSIEFVPED